MVNLEKSENHRNLLINNDILTCINLCQHLAHEALSLGDKELLLRNQAKLYDSLKFRGEWFYHDDIKRFAHPGLSSVVSELLDKSSSPELTDFLIQVARFGRLGQLAPKLANYVSIPDFGYRTKAEACTALHEIGDTTHRTDVLSAALTAECPETDDTDAATNWNMFQLKALQYGFEEATLLDSISILSRIQRERVNYSSATSQYLIEILEGLTVPEQRKWLTILLRFTFDGRTENRYRLPSASARYMRFVPGIIYLASQLVSREDTTPDDRDLIDAVEMAMGKEDRIDVFGRMAPTKSLTDGLRARPEVKHALIRRRVALFSDKNRRDRVTFETVYPLEFDDTEENGSFFEKSDVVHYCKLAKEAANQEEQAFLLDLARTILTKLRENDHDDALSVLLKHTKQFGDDEQKRQFGFCGWTRRMKSRFQYQYRYDVERWFRQQKNVYRLGNQLEKIVNSLPGTRRNFFLEALGTMKQSGYLTDASCVGSRKNCSPVTPLHLSHL